MVWRPTSPVLRQFPAAAHHFRCRSAGRSVRRYRQRRLGASDEGLMAFVCVRQQDADRATTELGYASTGAGGASAGGTRKIKPTTVFPGLAARMERPPPVCRPADHGVTQRANEELESWIAAGTPPHLLRLPWHAVKRPSNAHAVSDVRTARRAKADLFSGSQLHPHSSYIEP